MKKLFTLAAFLFIVAISSSALAANWVHVATGNDDIVGSIDLYVDKDSIKYGMHSESFQFSRSDGFSANIKVIGELTEIGRVGFFTERDKKYWVTLDDIDDSGNVVNADNHRDENCYYNVAEGYWITIYEYVQSNLP